MVAWFDAAEEGDVATIRALAQAGADIEATEPDALGPAPGMTAMLLAAGWGNVDVIYTLAELGANVEALTSYGQTAMMLAAGNGHVDVVRALARLGANLQATNQFGLTASLDGQPTCIPPADLHPTPNAEQHAAA